MERIGIFGGSFDPVHVGHLALARRALKAVPLDRVLFAPAADSPFKIGRMRASADDRLAMLELALEGEPRFGICRADLDRGGVSYTVDLVSDVRAAHPDAELFFLVGADSLAGLHGWYRAEELVRACRFVGFGRPGFRLDPDALGFDPATNARLAADFVADFAEPASSTEVRERLAAGGDAADLLPPAVARYVRDRGLYRAEPPPSPPIEAPFRAPCTRTKSAVLAICLAALAAGAETSFPAEGWTEEPSRYANPDAPKGGKLVLAAGAAPKSLNYYLENSTFAAQVCSMLYESLLSRDPDTGEYAPALARRWTVSDDGLAFTFEIDPDARWSDGAPVVAEDVRWTFDAVMAPTNMTGAAKVALATFDPPEVLGERTVRFVAHERHWRNLGAVGGLFVLPSHAFRGRDFNRLNFDLSVVSGPYRLGELRENRSLALERRPDWWAAARPAQRGLWNFDTVEWRFFASRENAWEAFRKGIVDAFAVYTASTWVLDARGERFDKGWIVRRAVRNRKPVGFQGFALNLRREPFDDVRVRRALALLLDRASFNRSLMFGQYFLHRSYWEDLWDEKHPCPNELLGFDPDRAAALLDEAGWTRDPATGRRRRGGRELVVRFLSNSPTSDKFLARWRVALEAQGIALKVERKDWAAWMRDMDEYDFDTTWCAWSSGLEKDPEGMWSGAQASEKGGNNITGFSDPRVDALIDAQRTELSLERRNDVCREIDAILAEAVPYILLWNSDATRLCWWNKFGMPPTILSRFGGEDDIVSLWWNDPDAEAALADAMAEGAPLPPPPGIPPEEP